VEPERDGNRKAKVRPTTGRGRGLKGALGEKISWQRPAKRRNLSNYRENSPGKKKAMEGRRREGGRVRNGCGGLLTDLWTGKEKAYLNNTNKEGSHANPPNGGYGGETTGRQKRNVSASFRIIHWSSAVDSLRRDWGGQQLY